MSRIREFMNKEGFMPITCALVMVNIIVFLMCTYFGDVLYNYGVTGLDYLYRDREYYRLISATFLHADIGHLTGNMMIILFMGSMIENVMGSIRFIILYFTTGAIGNLASAYYEYISGNSYNSLGASGVAFGIFGALIFYSIFRRELVRDINPIRVVVIAIFAIYSGLQTENVNNLAHIGGLLCGFVLAGLVSIGMRGRAIRRNI